MEGPYHPCSTCVPIGEPATELLNPVVARRGLSGISSISHQLLAIHELMRPWSLDRGMLRDDVVAVASPGATRFWRIDRSMQEKLRSRDDQLSLW